MFLKTAFNPLVHLVTGSFISLVFSFCNSLWVSHIRTLSEVYRVKIPPSWCLCGRAEAQRVTCCRGCRGWVPLRDFLPPPCGVCGAQCSLCFCLDVSGFKLRSLIHLELAFVKTTTLVSFFCGGRPVWPASFAECFSPHASFVKSWMDTAWSVSLQACDLFAGLF